MGRWAIGRLPTGNVTLYPQYSQAVDDEQGMRLIGHAFNELALAKVGIADTPGAYIVTRWVTEWERGAQ